MTKIVLAQINPSVSKVMQNLQKMLKVVSEAEENSLIVFPEMTMTGYPLEELVYSKELQAKTTQANYVLIEEAKKQNKTVLFGTMNEPYGDDVKPSNSVVMSGAPGVSHIQASKRFLSNEGAFAEEKLFTPGESIMSFARNDKNYSVLIGDDISSKSSKAMMELAAGETNTDVLIVISGNPFSNKAISEREDNVRQAVSVSGANVGIFLNLVGGQDDLVFDGRSFIFKKNVGIVKFLKSFEEDVFTFDIENYVSENLEDNNNSWPEDFSYIGDMYKASVLGLRDYVTKNNMSSVALGVSGGIDSALVATIAADAIGGENVYGVSMPSAYSSDGSVTDAEILMKNIGGNYRQVPIAPMFEAFMGAVALDGVAEENLQARIRGVILMGISNQEHHLVLAPGNKSELAVGYSTIYGDAVGGYAPIKDAYKTDVYAMSKWRNQQEDSPIPVDSITKEPSAELRPGQVDQETLPEYEILDNLLYDHIELGLDENILIKRYNKETVERITKMINRAEWKRRQYPVGPKLGIKSFGRERIVPIVR